MSVKQQAQSIIDNLPDNADWKMIFSALSRQTKTMDSTDWTKLAEEGLERAYGNDEPEYTSQHLKNRNPLYKP